MKDWFFHQEKGKTLGPISIDEAKLRIRDGRIRIFDLLFRDGDPQWRMALEFPDLRAEFNSSSIKELKDRPWVCLQRKGVKHMDFTTSGPYSTDDLRQALQAGKIAYSDYLWRDGFSEWKRIGTIEDFNRRVKDRPLETILPPEPPAAELLKNVVQMKRTVPPVPEPPPPEAAVEVGLPEEIETPPRAAAAPVSLPEAEEAEETPRPRRKGSKAADWSVVIGLFVLVILGGAAGYRYYTGEGFGFTIPQFDELGGGEAPPPVTAPVIEEPPTIKFEKPPEPVAETPPPVAPVKEEPVKETPVKETPPPLKQERAAAPKKSQPPTELYLAVQTVSSTQVKIEVRTDASGAEYPVYVQLVGQPGGVADGAAYYKFMKITPSGNGLKPLDLTGLKLPQGRFILRVEAGNLKKETKLAVGVGEFQFKQAVSRMRKMHAHQIWRERLALIKLSQDLEKRLTDALAGAKFSSKGLEQISAVTRSNGGNYALFDQWWELKEILTSAKASPSMALLGRLKKDRDALLSMTVWK